MKLEQPRVVRSTSFPETGTDLKLSRQQSWRTKYLFCEYCNPNRLERMRYNQPSILLPSFTGAPIYRRRKKQEVEDVLSADSDTIDWTLKKFHYNGEWRSIFSAKKQKFPPKRNWNWKNLREKWMKCCREMKEFEMILQFRRRESENQWRKNSNPDFLWRKLSQSSLCALFFLF